MYRIIIRLLKCRAVAPRGSRIRNENARQRAAVVLGARRIDEGFAKLREETVVAPS